MLLPVLTSWVLPTVFGDVLGQTIILDYNIDDGCAAPIKQHTYHFSVDRCQVTKSEGEYMTQKWLS